MDKPVCGGKEAKEFKDVLNNEVIKTETNCACPRDCEKMEYLTQVKENSNAYNIVSKI